MVSPDDEGFRFRHPGFNAFLAFDFGEFVDFAHVEAVEVDEILVLDSLGSTENVTMPTNERTTLTAVPLDEEGDMLAGSLVYRWASDNEAVIQIEAVGTSVQLTSVGEGTALVRVSQDEVSRVVRVVVRDGASAVTDGGSDAGPSDAAVPDAAAPDAAAVSIDGGTLNSDAGSTLDSSASLDSGSDVTIDAAIDSEATNTPGADAALDGGQ